MKAVILNGARSGGSNCDFPKKPKTCRVCCLRTAATFDKVKL
ncbi:MAG: hypothetical protein WC421_10675 [Elusimicrobiales bacterium]